MKLFDSFSSTKKSLKSNKKNTRIFLCGPTIYDYCHIGHARVFVIFDVLTRFLQSNNVHVRTLVNVIDIDPKMNRGGRDEKYNSVSEMYFNEFLKDLKNLGISDSSLYCRTSDHVEIIIDLIKRLLSEKKAYSINGNIYLDVSKLQYFGRLTHLKKDEMMEMRYDIDINKRDPRDMILWNTTDYFGLTYNDKILGNGIPTFHVQDTAVAMYHFNGIYEIQGGGKDLLYPHHEVQMALLQTLTRRKQPVSHWIHIGLILVKGKKMAKSYSNAVYIRDILNKFDANVLRIWLLSHHYRQSIEFKMKNLEKPQKTNEILEAALFDFDPKQQKKESGGMDSRFVRKFKSYLANDLDTPHALGLLVEIAKDVDRIDDTKIMAEILGLKY